MTGTALFSPCGRYRYTLGRSWAEGPTLNVIGLNPSTATAEQDDPTVRRCIGYARAWGFGSLIVTNIFALRSTDPAGLRAVDDPVGPANNVWLRLVAEHADSVLAAWGAHAVLQDRGRAVEALLDGLTVHCLGRTKDGYPKHPLYLARTVTPEPFLAWEVAA